MSHFTVLVIGEDPELQIAPFDENLEVPRYVEYTKQDLIDKGRAAIAHYAATTYADYLADPVEYKKDAAQGHIDYIEKEFPEKMNWTDEQVYEDETRYYDKEDIGVGGEVYNDTNPQGKWDWYQLGGRWTGYFPLKKGATGVTGDPSFLTVGAEEGFVDQARKGDIDFERMTGNAAKEAKIKWEKLKYLLGQDIPKIITWEQVLADESIKTIKEKRLVYNNQAGVVLLKKLAHETSGLDDQRFLQFIDLDKFQLTKEQYIERAKMAAVPTFAVIKDGVWYEKGAMGWWGLVRDEKAKDQWLDEFTKLVMDLPDDTLLSVYDCHI